jgi:hypothetical protein
MAEFGDELVPQAVENFDEIQFDVFAFVSVLTEHALPYMIHKIFVTYDFYNTYHISVSTLVNFSTEVSNLFLTV